VRTCRGRRSASASSSVAAIRRRSILAAEPNARAPQTVQPCAALHCTRGRNPLNDRHKMHTSRAAPRGAAKSKTGTAQ
jgi:hypothetical protein